MAAITIPPTATLKASNIQIMNLIRSDADLAYQNRIPEVTQANVQSVIDNLLNSRPLMNDFVNALVNRIGLVVGRNMVWNSPLSVFKKPQLAFGDTVEEYSIGLLKAKAYNADRDYLEKDIFGQETPDVEANFHRLNRQDMYKLTINEQLLRQAFLTPDGLSGFVSDLMGTMKTSDNVDEYRLTCQLFRIYENSSPGGFFKVQVPNVSAPTSGQTEAKAFLRRIREMAGNIRFPSTRYNASHMPTVANPDELVLITTPSVLAAIDVEALAAAFNISHTEIQHRTIVVQDGDLGISGAQAILTTEDFFQIYDNLVETRSISNPVGLYDNYFFHHWQIVSCSRFVPAVLFTTEAGTPVDEVAIVPPTQLEIVYDSEDIVPGGIAQLQATLTPADLSLDPDGGVVWSLSGKTSSRTRITQNGVLHIARDEVSPALTVTAYATVANSVNDTENLGRISGTVTWAIRP